MTVEVETRDGLLYLLSPAVGVFHRRTTADQLLSPGMSIGRLRVLNSWYELKLPDGVTGRAVQLQTRWCVHPVEYGEPLLAVDPQGAQTAVDAGAETAHIENQEGDKNLLVKAFTSGIFYRRPTPIQAPYVEVGAEIKQGKLLGLIEVMKSFNQVVFAGTRGVVEKVYVEDAQEVAEGQPLFLIAGLNGEKP